MTVRPPFLQSCIGVYLLESDFSDPNSAPNFDLDLYSPSVGGAHLPMLGRDMDETAVENLRDAGFSRYFNVWVALEDVRDSPSVCLDRISAHCHSAFLFHPSYSIF